MNYQEAAKAVVMQFLSAYAKRDVDACMGVIAKDTPLLILGTNADEVFRTQLELRGSLQRDFENMSNIELGAVNHTAINANEGLASVMFELPVSYQANTRQEKVLLRYAFTLVSENGNWRIVQAMASLPAPAGGYNFSSWE